MALVNREPVFDTLDQVLARCLKFLKVDTEGSVISSNRKTKMIRYDVMCSNINISRFFSR